MYITFWPEFARRAEELYAASPTKTRYVVKYRTEKNLLVLKITDDVTCLQHKTHSSLLLNRFDALNLQLMKRMRARPDPPALVEDAMAVDDRASVPKAEEVKGSGQPHVASSAGAGGGGKKKKKKGKK
ncbi:signal recognition particle SRP9/SRP14 subunit [Dacryopinax primogenitus]|uniref:Signal recognition particle SRP9/SRP14 subunit n=1 Tax=Dacryopinax primogenitus (strain DJM 731) TaxID=1858805 RepID=M5FSI1_DACPD|nr:signal recognition particle SRP9/SRP14 subunit [Dacryopinax primogenitus]EJU00401.1 signal recognition particle SRP9/SRP14 subunit [Dacryopinax primogenitus]